MVKLIGNINFRQYGTTPIDLIDGSDFAEHLKSLKLGVSIEKVEKVRINKDWFDNI